jgi:outer membrane receptor protein involved in Fe transport
MKFAAVIEYTQDKDNPLQWLAGVYYYIELNDSSFTFNETDTPQYDHVTDYLFNGGGGLPGAHPTCFPVLTPTPAGGFNINQWNGTSCPLQAFGVGPIGALFGYPGTTPSTVDNSPGGALETLFGFQHTGIGNGMLYGFNAFLRTQSEAVFAQLDYRPNNQWHFTLGGRMSWDQKQGFEQEIDVFWIPLVSNQAQAAELDFPMDPYHPGQRVTDYVGTSCSSIGVAGIQPFSATTPCPAHRSVKAGWSAPTGTLGVEWTPNDDTNVYMKYSRGYKSGGFNLGPLAAQLGGVGPEYVDDFEGGWKQNFGTTLQFDVAAFYYKYDGLQALNTTTQNSQPPIQINELVNIAKSHSWGVELEARWNPIHNFYLGLNYSHL